MKKSNKNIISKGYTEDIKKLKSNIAKLEKELHDRLIIEEKLTADTEKDIKFWEKVLNKIPVGVCIGNPENLLWVNKYLIDQFGNSAEDPYCPDSEKFQLKFHPDDTDQLKLIGEKIKNNEGYTGEFRIMDKNGIWKWFLISYSRFDPSNEILEEEMIKEFFEIVPNNADSDNFREGSYNNLISIGSFLNIDEQKNIELLLRENEKRYKKLVESLPDMALIHRNDKILFMNRAGLELTGYSECEITDLPLLDLVAEDYRALVKKNIKKRLAGKTVPDFEIEILKKNKNKIPMISRGTIITINGEKSTVSVLTDRSIFKTKESLQRYSRDFINYQEKDRANFAHELHDAVIQSLVFSKIRLNWIESKVPDLLKEQVRIIKDGIDGIQRDVRRISQDLHPVMLEDLGFIKAINKLVENYMERINIKLEMKGGNFLNDIPRESSIHLYRIIQEALNNIEKHSESTESNLSLKLNEKEMNVEIRDNGKGFIISDSQSESGDKIHIGLRNIKERITFLNGNLEIKSSPGSGTEIKITVPV